MANHKDDPGKEQPPRPSEGPGAKRPYATIDAKATEVRRQGAPTDTGGAKPGAAIDSKTESNPSPGSVPSPDQAGEGKAGALTGALASIGAHARSSPFLTHLAAGAAGALLVLLVGSLLTSDRAPESLPSETLKQLTKRLTDAEMALGLRPGATGLGGRLDELARSTAALGETQTRLAGDVKALESSTQQGQGATHELGNRLTKLEETLAVLGATTTGEPSEAAKAGLVRMERDLATVKTETDRLGQRINTLKSDLEERFNSMAKAADVAPLAAKLGDIQQDLQGFSKSEAERAANASRVVLALELANLKRAMGRGDSYVAELTAIKRLAGGKFNLTPLERHMRDGVPMQAELIRSFRKCANAMLDAEAETADASLIDRLLSGARSIVRIRKAGHSTDDTSIEAIVGRMEVALKEGRLDEVLAQGKKLPPKAALAAEDWLNKVEARHAVDRALADVDAALKASLSVERAGGSETK
jgi:hypothetical protein